MKKSICIEKLFLDLPFYERFDKTRKAGFDYIEFGSWGCHDVDIIQKKLKENNLQLGCFSGDMDYNLIDPAHSKEYVEYFRSSAEVAVRLGCKNLVVHSNSFGTTGETNTAGNENSDSVKIAAAAVNLHECAKICEEYDLYIQMEPVSPYAKPGYWMNTTSLAADLIRAVGSKRIRLLYDVFHMQQMEGDLTHTLRKHADILGYVHVGDVPDRHEPGTGEVNWDYLKHLIIDELQFDGIWAFELSPATTEEACLQALHAF